MGLLLAGGAGFITSSLGFYIGFIQRTASITVDFCRSSPFPKLHYHIGGLFKNIGSCFVRKGFCALADTSYIGIPT